MRLGEGLKTYGAMKMLCSVNNVSLSVMRELYEKVEAPRVTQGPETWGLRMEEKLMPVVSGAKCLRSVCDVTRMIRLRNKKMRLRVGVREKTSERVDWKDLKRF